MNTTIEQSNELLTLREKHEYEQEIAGLKAELKSVELKTISTSKCFESKIDSLKAKLKNYSENNNLIRSNVSHWRNKYLKVKG